MQVKELIRRRQLPKCDVVVLFCGKGSSSNISAAFYRAITRRCVGNARQLLLGSNHSIVQGGLMCRFSSGSHFSTAYGTLFGIAPREERQRKLLPAGVAL